MATTTATPQAIVQAAAGLFRGQGFAATTMRDVAETVGLSKAGLYHHFRSKEELLRDVVARGTEALMDQLETVAESGLTPGERLREFIVSRMETIAEFQDELTVIWQERPIIDAATFDVVARQLTRYRAGTEELIEAARTAGALRREVDAHVLMLAIDGMTGWSYLWMRPGQGLAPREIGERFWDYLGAGVSA